MKKKINSYSLLLFGLTLIIVILYKSETHHEKNLPDDESQISSSKIKEVARTSQKKQPENTIRRMASEESKKKEQFILNQEEAEKIASDISSNKKSDFQYDAEMSGHLSDAIFKVYTFRQTLNGHRVYSGTLKIFVAQNNNKLVRIQDGFLNIGSSPQEPSLPIEELIAKIQLPYPIDKSFLSLKSKSPWIYVTQNTTAFIYEVEHYNPKKISDTRVLLVDAQTGEVLKEVPTAFR